MSVSQSGLWEQLPKADQEKVKRALQEKNRQEVKPAPKKGQFQLRGYLRCDLSASDRESFKEWEASLEGLGWLDKLLKDVDSGYLLKMGESGQGFQASLSAST